MQYLPESRPSSIYTDTSFLYHSVPSLPLRARLCAKSNSFKFTPSFSETLQDEQDIHSALGSLTTWEDSRALQASTLLDLQLRQFLVILHSHKTLKPHSRSNPDLRYAFPTTIESCESLIDQHAKLLDSGNLALCCIRFDYLRAILVLCHIAYYASLASGIPLNPPRPPPTPSLTQINRHFCQSHSSSRICCHVRPDSPPSRYAIPPPWAREPPLLVRQCGHQPSDDAARA